MTGKDQDAGPLAGPMDITGNQYTAPRSTSELIDRSFVRMFPEILPVGVFRCGSFLEVCPTKQSKPAQLP